MRELVEEKFKEIFGTEGRFKTYFVPAKVNIVEEDEDYKGEMAPKTRAKKGVCATIREREDRILNFYSVNFSEAGIISISIDNVAYNENETWDSEVRLMSEIKTNFDMAIKMIENGEAEQSIIDAENWK